MLSITKTVVIKASPRVQLTRYADEEYWLLSASSEYLLGIIKDLMEFETVENLDNRCFSFGFSAHEIKISAKVFDSAETDEEGNLILTINY